MSSTTITTTYDDFVSLYQKCEFYPWMGVFSRDNVIYSTLSSDPFEHFIQSQNRYDLAHLPLIDLRNKYGKWHNMSSIAHRNKEGKYALPLDEKMCIPPVVPLKFYITGCKPSSVPLSDISREQPLLHGGHDGYYDSLQEFYDYIPDKVRSDLFYEFPALNKVDSPLCQDVLLFIIKSVFDYQLFGEGPAWANAFPPLEFSYLCTSVSKVYSALCQLEFRSEDVVHASLGSFLKAYYSSKKPVHRPLVDREEYILYEGRVIYPDDSTHVNYDHDPVVVSRVMKRYTPQEINVGMVPEYHFSGEAINLQEHFAEGKRLDPIVELFYEDQSVFMGRLRQASQYRLTHFFVREHMPTTFTITAEVEVFNPIVDGYLSDITMIVSDLEVQHDAIVEMWYDSMFVTVSCGNLYHYFYFDPHIGEVGTYWSNQSFTYGELIPLFEFEYYYDRRSFNLVMDWIIEKTLDIRDVADSPPMPTYLYDPFWWERPFCPNPLLSEDENEEEEKLHYRSAAKAMYNWMTGNPYGEVKWR